MNTALTLFAIGILSSFCGFLSLMSHLSDESAKANAPRPRINATVFDVYESDGKWETVFAWGDGYRTRMWGRLGHRGESVTLFDVGDGTVSTQAK